MAAVINSIAEFLTLSHILTIVYALNLVIGIAIIYTGSKSPTSTMAWIMILFMLPVVGLILYLIFSQNIARMKIYRMSNAERIGIRNIIDYQKEKLDEGLMTSGNPVLQKWRNMINLNLMYADAPLTYNDSVDIIFDGKEMFQSLCNDIRNAKYSIKVCYFIVKDDFVGQEFIDLLTQKAKEGVKVRLLLDALGSKSVGYFDLKEFREAGGKYAFFFKPRIRHLYFRINYRNHRKLVVIDNEIGYIGGFNIAREYLGLKKKFGYWRDTQLVIRGDALAALNERFYLDWRYSAKEKMNIVDSSIEYAYKSREDSIPIQIVSSGPESPKEEIKRAMMRMITGAKKSIYIQSPYLVPDQAMMESLAMAARAGIDVNIMIPCMPDHPFVYRTSLHNAGILLNEGAKIYIYDNGFIHAKTLCVDNEVCTVGSANFDNRSFRLNFESNAVIYDANIAGKMTAQYEKDIQLSHLYTLEDREKLSVWDKFAEAISRLLTEVL